MDPHPIEPLTADLSALTCQACLEAACHQAGMFYTRPPFIQDHPCAHHAALQTAASAEPPAPLAGRVPSQAPGERPSTEALGERLVASEEALDLANRLPIDALPTAPLGPRKRLSIDMLPTGPLDPQSHHLRPPPLAPAWLQALVPPRAPRAPRPLLPFLSPALVAQAQQVAAQLGQAAQALEAQVTTPPPGLQPTQVRELVEALRAVTEAYTHLAQVLASTRDTS